MNHTSLLNHLAKKHNYQSYLEIGVRTVEQNFNKIQCRFKQGVDPFVKHPLVAQETSDDFFRKNKNLYDLIFVDGLHHSDQAERDVENALKALSENGRIVIHDCLPKEEATTCVPRGTQKIWHGDVYKVVFKLNKYDGIDYVTYDFDEGCCVVWKDPSKIGGYGFDADWNFYQKNKAMMRIKENVDF